ncbi:neuronal growth regulator 1 isoform X2 [Misgurnus anguillicaudatus]|uniref:neuronal growth regulator 1 isoform X2 n=1 Tax=Misgurnus anguillicaudatus TaxID=75329 RepID=UPI002434BDAF|nr:neuronal growth regulator 1 isoform X2 [Misgurnus anguillicaudatus]
MVCEPLESRLSPAVGLRSKQIWKLHGTPSLGLFAGINTFSYIFLFLITARIVLHSAAMDIMIAVQDACVSGQWLTAIILSLCCFLPSCLPAGQTVEYASSESVVSRQGDTAMLRCYLLDGISKGAWLNRSSIIYAGNDKWSGDPRVSIVSNVGDKHEYSLQIQKVDVTDEGLYTCSIQSERNPRPKLIQLIVKVPPKIYDISSDITVNEGSNVSLICTASGKPEPKISWRHITPSARKYESGEYLNITNITRDQAGDYECGAENDISSPDTKTVRVTVNFPPAIHEMKTHGVRPGQMALLRCEAAAVPSPAFEWYKGEKRINMGQGIDIKNLSSRSILTVKNMTQDRYGNYTCVAVNRLGTANASVPLSPIIEPTTSSAVSSPAPNTAPYGSTGGADVLLACRYLILALSSLLSIY